MVMELFSFPKNDLPDIATFPRYFSVEGETSKPRLGPGSAQDLHASVLQLQAKGSFTFLAIPQEPEQLGLCLSGAGCQPEPGKLAGWSLGTVAMAPRCPAERCSAQSLLPPSLSLLQR